MIKISVIIPTFNRALFLGAAIDSVLSQTYKNIELIVVDDGSNDNTKEILKSYGDKLKYCFQENKGPASARNRGIEESSAEFIAFLDSDDRWDKNKLSIQLEEMQQNPDYLLSHTQEVWYKNGKLLNQKEKHKKFGGFIFDKCLPLCAIGMSTVMVRRELFEKIGLFDESFPCCEDYDLWLKLSVKFPVLFIDRPLTSKNGGRPDQVSVRYAQGMDRFRIQSIKRLLDENSLDSRQRALALDELQKKCRIYGEGCIKHGKETEGNNYLNLTREQSL